jgi:hypothetical protein
MLGRAAAAPTCPPPRYPRQGEKYADESVAFARETVLQRDVEVGGWDGIWGGMG